ncbi:MAG: FlgD immunoglobulin-like domain containing protein [bacterium]
MMAPFRVLFKHLRQSTANYCRHRLSALGLAGMTLVWQPNTENDLAGYKVYIGERSQQYTQIIDVGKNTSYALDHLPRDKTFYFVVTAYDLNGNESGQSQEAVLSAVPEDLPGGNARIEKTLATVYNFPNPFQPTRETTAIRYYLAQSGAVTIRIFDVKGDRIKTLLDNVPRPAGENIGDVWDGTDARGARVSAGLYYLEIQAQGQKAIIRAAVVP